MLGEFISIKDYKSIAEVQALYPGCKVVWVPGGWMVFDSLDEFEEWRKSK